MAATCGRKQAGWVTSFWRHFVEVNSCNLGSSHVCWGSYDGFNSTGWHGCSGNIISEMTYFVSDKPQLVLSMLTTVRSWWLYSPRYEYWRSFSMHESSAITAVRATTMARWQSSWNTCRALVNCLLIYFCHNNAAHTGWCISHFSHDSELVVSLYPVEL